MTKAERIEKSLLGFIEKDAETRTQDGLAADAGVSAPSIHHFRKGNKTLKWTTVARIMAALDLEIVPARKKEKAKA